MASTTTANPYAYTTSGFDFLHRPDSFLHEFGIRVAKWLGLPHLADHFSTLVYSALGFTVLHLVVAPGLSKVFASETYAKQRGRKARNNW